MRPVVSMLASDLSHHGLHRMPVHIAGCLKALGWLTADNLTGSRQQHEGLTVVQVECDWPWAWLHLGR